MIPFVPIIQENEEPFAMFRDLAQKNGEWVFDVLNYDSVDTLLTVMHKAVILPSLEMGRRLLVRKSKQIRIRHVRDHI